MPALPVSEHKAQCAQLIREQEGRAGSELAVLRATHEPLSFWSSRRAESTSGCAAVRQHPHCEQHVFQCYQVLCISLRLHRP